MEQHFVILTPGFSASEEDTKSIVFLQSLVKSVNISFPKIKITIITLQFPFTSVQYTWFGNTVIPLNGGNSRAKKIFVWAKAWRKLKKIHIKTPISGILCCWLTECSLVGKKFAEKHDIPYILWAPGQDAKPENRYLKWLNLSGKEVAVISEHQIELLKKSAITCTKIIPNGILPEDFTAFNREQLGFSIHILAAGSLIELKNYLEFIAIIELVTKQFPTIKCEIIGEGPQHEMLEKAISDKKLQNNISLLGALPHKQVIEKMHNSLVFLHPSVYEGNATVLIEAAYAGNYIVCRKETASHKSNLIKHYTSGNSAAEIIIDILKKNQQNPAKELLSSMHDSAKEMLRFLKII